MITVLLGSNGLLCQVRTYLAPPPSPLYSANPLCIIVFLFLGVMILLLNGIANLTFTLLL